MREGFHFRLDPDGTFMWVRGWSNSNVYVKNIQAVSASQYLLFGCDYNTSASTNADILTARVDAATGNVTWVSPRMDLYNTVPYIDDICGVAELNGAYFMTGRVFTNGSPVSTCRVNVAKFNASGQHQWTRYLMYSNTQSRRMYGADIIANNDSLTVFWMGDVTGATANWLLGVTRLDQNGNIVWSRSYNVGNSSLELAERIVATDFGYAMTAQYSFGTQRRILLMGIDHSGNLLWTRTHGPQAQAQSMRWQYQKNLIALDGGLMYTGGAPGTGGSDLLLVRTALDGTLDCEASGDLAVSTSVLPTATFNSPYGATNASFSLSNTNVQPNSTSLVSSCDALQLDLGPDVSTCDPMVLDATTPGAEYLWQDGSTDALFQVAVSGTYWVQVTVDCCVLSDTIVVHIGTGVGSIDLGPDRILCPGEELEFSVDAQYAPILWSNGLSLPSISVDSPGTYWVQVGEGACTVSDTVLVLQGSVPDIAIVGASDLTCEVNCIQLSLEGAGQGTNVVWNTGAMTPGIDVCEPGAYSVTVTTLADGCAASAEVSIAQNLGVPKFSVSDAVLPCDGGCTTLEAMSAIAGLQFEWSGPGGGTGSGATFQACVPGEYVLVGTNSANGCSVELNATVTQSDAVPGIVVSGGTVTCLDPCVTLVVSSAGVDVGYSWWGPTGGGDGPSLEACVPGVYMVVVSGDDYCPTSTTVIVSEEVDGPEISATGGTLNCLANSVALQATGNGSFLWTGPEGFSSTEQSPIVSVAGTYLLTVVGENGCQSTASVEVMLDTEEPGASALGAVIGCDVESIMILGGGNGTFAWSGPNGFSSVEQNPLTSVPGTYSLTVTGSNGCTSSATAVVSEDECDDCGPLVVSCSVDVTIECGMSDHPLDIGAPIFRKVPTCPEVTVGWTDQWFGNCPWTLVRTWTATDSTGAVEVCIQTITVVDTQGPSFMCEKPVDIIVDCSNIPAPLECVAVDECDGVLAVTMTEEKTGEGCKADYTISRTYSAVDACGNSSSFEQVILVMNSPAIIQNKSLAGHVVVNVAPNPFHNESRIFFQAPSTGDVTMEITDIHGRRVVDLYQTHVTEGQEVSVLFRPERSAAGVYLYRITLGGSELRGRLLYQP